jgi:hypothetical protein
MAPAAQPSHPRGLIHLVGATKGKSPSCQHDAPHRTRMTTMASVQHSGNEQGHPSCTGDDLGALESSSSSSRAALCTANQDCTSTFYFPLSTPKSRQPRSRASDAPSPVAPAAVQKQEHGHVHKYVPSHSIVQKPSISHGPIARPCCTDCRLQDITLHCLAKSVSRPPLPSYCCHSFCGATLYDYVKHKGGQTLDGHMECSWMPCRCPDGKPGTHGRSEGPCGLESVLHSAACQASASRVSE